MAELGCGRTFNRLVLGKGDQVSGNTVFDGDSWREMERLPQQQRNSPSASDDVEILASDPRSRWPESSGWAQSLVTRYGILQQSCHLHGPCLLFLAHSLEALSGSGP